MLGGSNFQIMRIGNLILQAEAVVYPAVQLKRLSMVTLRSTPDLLSGMKYVYEN